MHTELCSIPWLLGVVHDIHATKIKTYPPSVAKEIYANPIRIRSEPSSIVGFAGEKHFYCICEVASPSVLNEARTRACLSYPQDATTPDRS